MSDGANHLRPSSLRADTLALFRSTRPFGAAFLDSLVKPKTSSVGVQILKRMGWKEGQGLGPRVTAARRAQLLAQYQQLSSSSSQSKLDDQANKKTSTRVLQDEEAKKHLFPPPDTQLLLLDGKEDRRGLGYAVNKSMAMALEKVHSERTVLRNSGDASGVTKRPGRARLGIDSDEEDDELMGGDERADMRASTLGDIPARGSLGAHDWRGANAAGSKSSFKLQVGGREETIRADEDDRLWSDGRPLPPGFRRAAQVQKQDTW